MSVEYYIHERGRAGHYWEAPPGALIAYDPTSQCVTRISGAHTCACGELLIGPRPPDPVASYWWPWSEIAE